MNPQIHPKNLPPRLRLSLWISLYLLLDKFNVSEVHMSLYLSFVVLTIMTKLWKILETSYVDVFYVLEDLLRRTSNKGP